MLDQGFESKSESRTNGVKERNHVNTSEIGEGWVDGSECQGVMRGDVVVFQLNHGVTGSRGQLGNRRRVSFVRVFSMGFSNPTRHQKEVTHLRLNLSRVRRAPRLVCSGRDRTGMIHSTLQEGLSNRNRSTRTEKRVSRRNFASSHRRQLCSVTKHAW